MPIWDRPVSEIARSLGSALLRLINPPASSSRLPAVRPPPPASLHAAAPRPKPAFGPAAPPLAGNAAPKGSESVASFRRQLYSDKQMTLYFDPRGLGMLWLSTAAGCEHVAGPQARWYFMTVVERFEELGQPPVASNAYYRAMTGSFAQALLTYPPDHHIWSEMVRDDPRHVARCFAGLERPRPGNGMNMSAAMRTAANDAMLAHAPH